MGVSLLAVCLTGPEERRHGKSLPAHPFHPRLIQVSLTDRPATLRNVECLRSVSH